MVGGENQAVVLDKPDNDQPMNETRYQKIVEESRFSLLALLHASFKEDPEMILPRSLVKTFGTAKRILHSTLLRKESKRDAYVAETFERWADSIVRIASLKLCVQGSHHVPKDRTCLFVVNHQSALDIPVLIKAIPKSACFVANEVISQIPVFSYWIRRSGAVLINQEDDGGAPTRALREMISRLKQGKNLILFPEGYIHQGEGVAEFKRGGIHAAILAGVPIVPVCLYGTQQAFPPGDLSIKSGSPIFVEFGDPVDTKALSRQDRTELTGTLMEIVAAMRLRLERLYHEALGAS